MKVDIYDFDKTLVPFDSGSLFIGYCLIHYPWTVITLPLQAVGGLLALLGIIDFTAYKKFCFSFVALIPLDKAVEGFWKKHENRLHKWFLEKKRYSVVISASPDFLLNYIKDRFGIDTLICSRHNRKTGALIGQNCRNKEKVKRFYEIFDKDEVEVCDVYSDSIKHDEPIFSLANENCYHIVNGEKIKFSYSDVYK